MIKSALKSLLARCGYDLHRYRRLPILHTFLKAWKSLGLAPDLIVDIGANHGEWSRITSDYFPDATYLLIEPQERLKVYSQDLLARPNFRWKTAGASDQPGRLLLSIPARDDGATFMPPSPGAQATLTAQVEVEVITLNDIVQQERRAPTIVKIDAEGFDMRVLRGASATFGQTELFFIECAIGEIGLENSLQTVCNFMDSVGYRPVDITELNRYHPSGALMLCDVVFLRKASALWTALATSA